MKTVTIFEPRLNDTWPYFTCPDCGNQNITRAFQRCIDCGAIIKWGKKKDANHEHQKGLRTIFRET